MWFLEAIAEALLRIAKWVIGDFLAGVLAWTVVTVASVLVVLVADGVAPRVVALAIVCTGCWRLGVRREQRRAKRIEQAGRERRAES